MTILDRPKLGTDPVRGWMYYDLHFASSYVFGEAILVGNYRSCIARAEVVQAVGLGDWARKMKAQDYHELYAHAFVSMWSAFETGMENMVATYLQNDAEAARSALAQLPKGGQAKYPLAAWPWTREACLRIATSLESISIKATPNGGIDLFGRIKTMLGWLDVHVEDMPDITTALAEANRVRNIILHRYGEVILPLFHGHPVKRFTIATGGGHHGNEEGYRIEGKADAVQRGVQAAGVAARGEGRGARCIA